jgi:tRNA dimethylallyltransferase
MDERREQLLVICGPTATGKTDLAIALARHVGGEVVNADSRQVYCYMNVGTAKPTPAQRAATPHHLLDVADPDEPFTLADYLERAHHAIAGILTRGCLPIVVGGTGLYVRALAQGFAVPRVPPDPRVRAELEALAEAGGSSALLARLRRSDPHTAATIDARNPRRLIRAIEVAEATGVSFATQRMARPRYDALVLGLTADRALLYERADRRVDAMMAAGFLDEVAALYARGYSSDLPALSGLGYRQLGEHLRGAHALDDAVQATKLATHGFIRRQLTWFRREPGIHWLDIAHGDVVAQAIVQAEQWLAAPMAAGRAV